jgi:O-antigen ligase
MAGWLVFQMARRVETARMLFNALIAITAFYAMYAFVLAFTGVHQVNVFYSVPYQTPLISGPFMLHNSFATYCGLGALAAGAKLCSDGAHSIHTGRGIRRLAETTLQYCFGRGASVLIALILCFAGVVASASRAGFVATLVGMITLALMAAVLTRGRTGQVWAGLGALAAAAPIVIILIFNGDTLASRIDQLLVSEATDGVRFALWDSARRMIADAPFLGLGLGTFQDAYPLYAIHVFPYVMDKAHCDYLEFAAGIGLPAAIAWWCALLWLLGANLRAVFKRRRDRVFSIVALGGTVLVTVHSCVDFSLQLPAVSLSFVTLLAIGSAQCLSSRQH